jgi:hypothetical protein
MQLPLPPGPGMHAPSNAKCPFCPKKDDHPYKTWPGKKNNSKILRTIMNNPKKLTSEQANAKPKSDKPRQTYAKKAIYTHKAKNPRQSLGPYGDQAHHAISGKQILSGHKIEKLIKKGTEIKADTGYSVNNAANGICLPSFPKKFGKKHLKKHQRWGSFGETKKQRMADLPMKNGRGQVHIGEHDLAYDPDTPKVHHTSYPAEAVKLLDQLYDVAKNRWEPACPLCEEAKDDGEKLPPPYRLNKYLDMVSAELIAHITADPGSWVYFISDYAANFHDTVCPHEDDDDDDDDD